MPPGLVTRVTIWKRNSGVSITNGGDGMGGGSFDWLPSACDGRRMCTTGDCFAAVSFRSGQFGSSWNGRETIDLTSGGPGRSRSVASWSLWRGDLCWTENHLFYYHYYSSFGADKYQIQGTRPTVWHHVKFCLVLNPRQRGFLMIRVTVRDRSVDV